MVSIALFLAITMSAEIQSCVVRGEDPDTETGAICVASVAHEAADRIIMGEYPAYLHMDEYRSQDSESLYQSVYSATHDMIESRKDEIFK